MPLVKRIISQFKKVKYKGQKEGSRYFIVGGIPNFVFLPDQATGDITHFPTGQWLQCHWEELINAISASSPQTSPSKSTDASSMARWKEGAHADTFNRWKLQFLQEIILRRAHDAHVLQLRSFTRVRARLNESCCDIARIASQKGKKK